MGTAAGRSEALRPVKCSERQCCKTVPYPSCGRTSDTERLLSEPKQSNRSTASAAPSRNAEERSCENRPQQSRSSSDRRKSPSSPLKCLCRTPTKPAPVPPQRRHSIRQAVDRPRRQLATAVDFHEVSPQRHRVTVRQACKKA